MTNQRIRDIPIAEIRVVNPRPRNEIMFQAIVASIAKVGLKKPTQQQRALGRRSAVVTERLAVITSSLRQLLADDHFVTLLRAEGLKTLPEYLANRLGAQ